LRTTFDDFNTEKNISHFCVPIKGVFHLIISLTFLTFFSYEQMECNSNFFIWNHSIVKLASLGNAILCYQCYQGNKTKQKWRWQW